MYFTDIYREKNFHRLCYNTDYRLFYVYKFYKRKRLSIMSRSIFKPQPKESPSNILWLLISLGLVAVHQVQSVIVEPEEAPFRYKVLTIIALLPFSLLLPARLRGALWIVLGSGPAGGAFIGHLIPIVRDQKVPPASETAPLNLAGASFLIALGAAQLFAPFKK